MAAQASQPPRTIRQKGRRPDIESELKEKYAVGFTFAEGVETSEFDIDKSLNNQARFEPIDEDTAQAYQEAVERGDPFPAVLAYRQGRGTKAKLVTIDGNHRLVAHDRAGEAIDVYEIDRDTKPTTIAHMTFAFNTRHGRPTSEEERATQAIYLIDQGASQSAAAEAVNVPMRVLKRALAKRQGDERADAVGADRRMWDGLPNSSRARLLNVKTDEGFLDSITLVHKANLNADEVFQLVALLNSTQSGTKQRQMVKAQTEVYADRIQAAGGGVIQTGTARRAMTPKARVSMLLGQVLSLPEDVTTIARSYANAEAHDIGQRLIDASERLRKLALAVDSSLK